MFQDGNVAIKNALKMSTKQISVSGYDSQVYNVTLDHNNFITIDCFYKNAVNPRQTITTFNIGSQAEYGSYNLSYVGTITGITDKTVTIVESKGTRNEVTHRLKIAEFCWRNFNFDLAKVQKANANWYD